MDKIPEEDKNVMNVTVINKPKKTEHSWIYLPWR